MARVGLRRASIYVHMNNGTFPRSVKLTSHAIGWRENEIEAWLASRCRTKTDALLKA
jgi:prophage regulatory protein